MGYFSDKTKTKIGKRTLWYIFGFIMVLLTFLPVFHDLNDFFPKNKPAPEWASVLYYISFPALFNVGWAAV
jgi:Na+/melibiose symporter-like transporter